MLENLNYFAYDLKYDYVKSVFNVFLCDRDSLDKKIIEIPFKDYFYIIEKGSGVWMDHPYFGQVEVRKIYSSKAPLLYENKVTFNVGDIEIKFLVDNKLRLNDVSNLLKYSIAFDIETEIINPQPGKLLKDHVERGELEITSISFYNNTKNFILLNKKYYKDNFGFENAELLSEEDLIRKSIEELNKFVYIIGFNSSDFDNLVLYNRSKVLGLEDCIKMFEYNEKYNYANILSTLTIDLYPFLKSRAVAGYIYWGKYKTYSLKEIAKSLLNEEKLENDFKVFNENSIKYNLKDSYLTFKLFEFNHGLILNSFLKYLNINLEDMFHRQLSYWAQYLIKTYMLENNILITSKDFNRLRNGDFEIEEYEGGGVLDPVPGVYRDVMIFDFSSLYANIIKYYNVSFETMNCGHDECKKEKLPGVEHYSCKIRKGIISTLVSKFLSDRENITSIINTKKSSEYKDPGSPFYTLYLQQYFCKIFNNGIYGLMAFKGFAFENKIAAESITGIGRYFLNRIKENLESKNLARVLYGDTDSFFVYSNNTIEIIQNEINNMCPLPIKYEKTYKHLILSERKKNYLGISNEKVEYKGLQLKKTNSPKFFDKIMKDIDNLAKKNINDVEKEIYSIFKRYYIKLEKRLIPNSELAVKIRVSKDPDSYKTETEIVKISTKTPLKMGEFVEFYKTRKGVALVNSKEEPDYKKYKELLVNTAAQILSDNYLNQLKGIRGLDSFGVI